MRAVDLVEKIYQYELALKNEIAISLNVPITLMSFFGAAVGACFLSFHYNFTGIKLFLQKGKLSGDVTLDILFIFSSLVVATLLLYSVVTWFKAYTQPSYTYLRTNERYERLADDDGLNAVARQDLENDLEKILIKKLVACNQNNSQINNIRINARNHLTQVMQFAAYAFLVSMLLFFIDFFSTKM